MTGAKGTFDTNVQRASYFLDIHKEAQEGPGAPSAPYQELPRGAIVFAVGALDAYLAEVSAEVLVREAQRNPASRGFREVLRKIQVDLPSLSLEVALLSSQAERVRRLQDCVVDHFQNHVSNHGVKAVAAAVLRAGGKVESFWARLRKRGFPKAASDLDHWTEVRHDIVHRGKKPAVRRPQARNFIRLATAIVEELEKLAVVAGAG